MNPEQIKKDWESRGYSFGIFKDPPGQVWADIEGKPQQPPIGKEIFIPAKAKHTVRNVGKTNNAWYFGYKK